MPSPRFAAAALTLLLATGASAQYGPDPPNTPPDFMCAWRKLAADYAHRNRPDAAALVHDALQLSKYCPGSQRPSELPSPSAAAAAAAAAQPEAGATYVDAVPRPLPPPRLLRAPNTPRRATVAPSTSPSRGLFPLCPHRSPLRALSPWLAGARVGQQRDGEHRPAVRQHRQGRQRRRGQARRLARRHPPQRHLLPRRYEILTEI